MHDELIRDINAQSLEETKQIYVIIFLDCS